MKRYLLIIALLAEDHLTPRAAAAEKEYMGGESIVTFSSYPDAYRDRLNAGLKQSLADSLKFIELAMMCLPVRENVKKGDVLDLIRSQIRTAGYRLAHQLNMIFDPAYARRHR